MNGVPSQGGEAFLWQDGQVRELQTLPDALGSQARDLADNTLITGSVLLPDLPGSGFVAHPFLFETGMMHDLGLLPGHTDCHGWGVNQLGEVVGRCTVDGSASRGFLYSHVDGMRSLNDIVDHPVPFVMGGAINDLGDIAARDWEGDLVILRPDRPPTDLDADCRTGESDLLVLLGDWGEQFSPADIDGDGKVGFHDLMLLLDGWHP